MILVALLVAVAALLTWRPLTAAIPSESILVFALTGGAMLVLLAVGHAG
ncbi:MAG: hypothetical protein IT304_05345 [Dehalococcoidia bacterium]|nr:hypothetical protein [Dehalococcoidia bacterium]